MDLEDDRVSQPDTVIADNTSGTASNAGPSWGVKLFFGLAILGFAAAGYGGIKTYLDQSRESERLQENGVLADADVTSVMETSGRRIETYHDLTVSYDPPGPRVLEFSQVQDCSGARYEAGIETVRVVYLPQDPDVIRLEACEDSFDANVFPGIVGLIFISFTLFMLWRSRQLWTS